jgi:hypothetical protein
MADRRARVLVPVFLGAVLVGCSDNTTPQPSCCDVGTQEDSGADRGQVSADKGRPSGGCDCKASEVCNTAGVCVPTPVPSAGEILGELVLLQQVSPMDTSILARLGKGEASFYAQEPLPTDTRKSYTNSSGEKCFFEIGTTYPSYFDGKIWPAGKGLGAGNLTFTVTGAAGPIVLEAANYSGWSYFHKDVPPQLKQGASSYPDFFDPAYLPAGAAFQVQAAGGPDVAAATFNAGELPASFTISSPAAEAPGAQAPAGKDLVVTWTPAQSSATMEVFITSMVGTDVALLTCVGRDDGSLTVPTAALANFSAGQTLGLQLRRTTDRYAKLSTTGGKVLHLHLLGRLARLGKFQLK